MASEIYPCTTIEIVRSDDPAWQTWKQIYYDSFPENELMSEDYFLRVMESKANKGASDKHILALRCSSQDAPIGMAYYEYHRELGVGFLWYIAIRSECRNQGYGACFYSAISQQLLDAGAKMLVYEVDIPEHAGQKSPEEREWAQRRINWYKRQGASVLNGIQYFQEVDSDVPPTEMWLMVHPLISMEADDIYLQCKLLFGDSLTQTAKLELQGESRSDQMINNRA